jgi:hypothetical protein
MRLKILGGIVVLMLALSVGTANARYYMRYGQAKQASVDTAKSICQKAPECIGWRVDQCLRRSPSRFDCGISHLYRFVAEQTESEVEMACDSVLHWGASIYGYVALKGATKPQCYEYG